MSAGYRLRKLLDKKCVCLPGAFNGIIGRMITDMGFDACYVSGAAVSACAGVPDIGIVDLSSFTKVIKEISTVSNLPILADADTGFGEIEMIQKTVYEYIKAGGAGLHIEDQVYPKRCGHLDNKLLIKTEEMCEKIKRAVLASKKYSNEEFIICARTDAKHVEGLYNAIDRAKKYIEAGAHMIFPEGLENINEFNIFSKEIKKFTSSSLTSPRFSSTYLLANMTEFGKTQHISVNQFNEIGYNAVIFPVSTLRVTLKAVHNLLYDLKHNASLENNISQMYTRNELYNTLKYTPGKEWTYPSSSSSENQ